MNLAIETTDLSKFYGEVCAIASINLRVKPGEIYGFIGLNGAGKTTTIRALLGMIRPSAGSVRVLDHRIGTGGNGPWQKIGYMVETPAAYPDLSVWENLEIARRLRGLSDSNATHRITERMGLSACAHRKAGTLSTGNLQRLGLARALLHEPELLILDEPVNGLDPAGVVEIRELLSTIARVNHVTVFMSSHILTEVDRLANRIGIIHRGRLLEELDAEKLDELRSKRLMIQARNLEGAKQNLTQAGYLVRESGDAIHLKEESAIGSPDEVAAILVRGGTPPTRLAVEQEDLEGYFLRLTGATQ